MSSGHLVSLIYRHVRGSLDNMNLLQQTAQRLERIPCVLYIPDVCIEPVKYSSASSVSILLTFSISSLFLILVITISSTEIFFLLFCLCLVFFIV